MRQTDPQNGQLGKAITMQPIGDMNFHYWLTLGMAKAVGVNLTNALHEGRISRAQYADIVTRCCGCTWGGGCVDWLAKQTDIADEVPLSCANHDTFKALRAGASLAEEVLPA